MSYGMMPFAVDFHKLRGWIGSGNAALLDEFRGGWTDLFAEIDELDDPDEPGLPSADALRHLILGEPFDPDYGFKYAYLLKQLAWEAGDHLPNLHWGGVDTTWIYGTFDPALAAAGVPAKSFGVATHLLYRGATVPIPDPYDFPLMGYLLPEEAPAVAAALAGIDPERFRPIDGHEQFHALRGWLETCRTSGRGLMTFYH
ncbi:MAG: hypothetical protein K2X82_13435 [Gemmataceae bacterium]|nr:hypothetical protein [Gemmataceae bacterium]